MKPSKYTSLETLEITHPDLSTAVATVKKWQMLRKERPGLSLVLVGPNGRGKTHIALSILWLNRYVIDGHPVAYTGGRFFKSADLVQMLDESRPEDLINPKDITTVVVDDVGNETNFKYIAAPLQKYEIQDRLLQVVNHCKDNTISLIVTGSNNCGTQKQLSEYLGPRSWDRLLQMCPSLDGISFMLNLARVPSYRKMDGGR